MHRVRECLDAAAIPLRPPSSPVQLAAGDTLAERLSAMTHDLLAAAGADRRLIWTNPAWQPLLGWSAEELAAGSYHALVHPDDLERVQQAERAVLAGRAGERPETELRLRGRDGAYRWFVFSTSYSPLDEVVFFCGKDITARKRGEEEVRAAEERFRAVTGSTSDGIVSADVGGRIIFWNAGAEAMFGRSAADALGRPLTDLMPERYHQAHQAGTARFLATGEGRLLGSTVEVEGLRADGTEFPLELSLGSWSQSGQRCFTGVLRDVSDRVRARGALEERARELERSNAELEQFAYVASHDLSEPLRMVSSYLQLLRRRYHGQLDADADEFIDYAVGGASRMRDLIDDLLTYSRAGRADQPFAPVDTRELAERAAEASRAAAEAGPARVAIGPLPTVAGDEQSLGQLFQNLIGNAVKFVPADRAAEVEVDAERAGADWRFTVADNGIGLEPAHAERIFRMFQRLHTRDEYAGTGIGLAIARKVVERHGGTIWAEPRAEGGSRFRFTLPAEAQPR